MLKLIWMIVKILLFSLIVLVLGNWLTWDGKSLSDQVKTQMNSHLANSYSGP